MTQLPHPSSGYNELWRSTAYDSLESLAMFFENPRKHTGKGYRQASKACRGCAKCGMQKNRTEYSQSQWKAGQGKAVCSECVASAAKTKKDGNGSGGGGKNKENESFPRLSEEALQSHDKNQLKSVKNEMERRQFNCPLCPQEGRGKNVFFKKVPVDKPIVKCPKCKKVKQGNCDRLYPIPRGEEKGYGESICWWFSILAIQIRQF